MIKTILFQHRRNSVDDLFVAALEAAFDKFLCLLGRLTAKTHQARHGQNMQDIRKISGVTAGEIWLTGTISPTARKNLEAQNWVVHENKGRALGIR